jgi:hypothetical protein
VPPSDAARTLDLLRAAGESPFRLGEVVAVPAETEFEARVQVGARALATVAG